MERIKSCIQGLDDLIEGGFPKGSKILVTGTPGTGKSTLALQFIVKGAELYGEKGLFITFEEPFPKLREKTLTFGWDLEKLQEEGKILVFNPDIRPEKGEEPLEWLTSPEIKDRINDFEPERVGIDSLTLLSLLSGERSGYRRRIQRLIEEFGLGCTALFTHERETGRIDDITYTMEEFIIDGIIYLQLVRVKNSFRRLLTILKMRVTDHSKDIHPFDIRVNEGIIVYPKEMTFV
jgi:KaiC/GvpD/RAD55 family RecA-like ATPase